MIAPLVEKFTFYCVKFSFIVNNHYFCTILHEFWIRID